MSEIEKNNNISQIIRSTEEYSDVCDMCRDEILLSPIISGKTTLKRIIDKVRAKEQDNKKLKEELKEQTGGLRPELKRLINKICRKYDIEAKTYHEKIVEIIHSLDDCNQALIEIKEIAKNMNKGCFYDDFDCKDCDMKNGCTYQGKIKILQKSARWKMTDKQIIIDDVDVSKCSYFNNIDKSYCEECCSEFGCAICNDRPNCYYKQLKRKQQECEELKKIINEAKER